MSAHPLLPRELQFAAVLVLLSFLGWVLYLVRSRRVSLRDSLLWVLSTFGALLITLFPQTLKWAAVQLRIEIPSNALFGAAILYLAFNLLSATIALSNAQSRARRLTQECTLLRAEIDDLRMRVENVERINERPEAT